MLNASTRWPVACSTALRIVDSTGRSPTSSRILEVISLNHAAFSSGVALHWIPRRAKMARGWIVCRDPLWATFGPPSTVSSAFQQLRSAADTKTGNTRQSLKESDAIETANSATGAADATRAHLFQFGDECSSHWTGLICLQKQAAERARIEPEKFRLLENENMQAKSNTSDQVTGHSSDILTSLKPLTHSRPCSAGQFSRGVHTSAAHALPNDRTVNCNPKNASHADNIKIEFPQIDTNYDTRPSRNGERINTRHRLIRYVRNIIQYKYGTRYDVQPYGSSVYMPMQDLSTTGDGDLDLVVLDSKWPQGFSPEMDMEHLPLIYHTRKLALTMRYAGFTDVEAIPWARVPIVKFTDPSSGLHIDINVNERLGLMNTDLIKTYCDVVPSLRYLVSAIKKWARPRALNQPSASGALQTFNSYALVLMTIAWLQTRGLAPRLQVGFQPMGSNEDLLWMRPTNSSKRIPCDTRYRKPTAWATPRMDAVDNLVEEWFRFWAHFQFSRHVIDIKRGGVFPRIPHFEGAAQSDHVSRRLRSELHNSWSAVLGPDVDSMSMLERYPISVVDPFIRSKNVTRNINAQALHMFQAECTSAVGLLERGVDMADIIDGFDMLKQDLSGHRMARLQQSRKDPPFRTPAESPLSEVRTFNVAHLQKLDAIYH
ncbi:hypothetical protein DEU56DRAFT_819796 [Suillus clintonianus]|uniref:uncharacterized protein n=1 Tax=Suillus clintonianus TaxID=1904413 RepID=UPI001B8738AB|nr:uncharacterized protein DEU56DRAFT_819796 [Suillus clintonianus]KAG2127988.1 hypothetical protein DEU56DRAFT_819796 [Suillus clintonianus]